MKWCPVCKKNVEVMTWKYNYIEDGEERTVIRYDCRTCGRVLSPERIQLTDPRESARVIVDS